MLTYGLAIKFHYNHSSYTVDNWCYRRIVSVFLKLAFYQLRKYDKLLLNGFHNLCCQTSTLSSVHNCMNFILRQLHIELIVNYILNLTGTINQSLWMGKAFRFDWSVLSHMHNIDGFRTNVHHKLVCLHVRKSVSYCHIALWKDFHICNPTGILLSTILKFLKNSIEILCKHILLLTNSSKWCT